MLSPVNMANQALGYANELGFLVHEFKGAAESRLHGLRHSHASHMLAEGVHRKWQQ